MQIAWLRGFFFLEIRVHNITVQGLGLQKKKFSVLRQIFKNSATLTKHSCKLFVFYTKLPSPVADQ